MFQTVVDVSKHETHQPIEHSIGSSALNALLMHIAQGIAQYAKGMRRYSATDQKVDLFVSEIISLQLPTTVEPLYIAELLHRARSIRDRAATLYKWSSEASGRTPKPIDDGFAYLRGDINRIVFNVESRRNRLCWNEEVRSQREVCENKLKAFATMLLSISCFNNEEYDGFGFVYDTLLMLDHENDYMELVDLSCQLEEQTLYLIHLLLSGNTLIDVPQLRVSTKKMRVAK